MGRLFRRRAMGVGHPFVTCVRKNSHRNPATENASSVVGQAPSSNVASPSVNEQRDHRLAHLSTTDFQSVARVNSHKTLRRTGSPSYVPGRPGESVIKTNRSAIFVNRQAAKHRQSFGRSVATASSTLSNRPSRVSAFVDSRAIVAKG
jgi:hypothetical protein